MFNQLKAIPSHLWRLLTLRHDGKGLEDWSKMAVFAVLIYAVYCLLSPAPYRPVLIGFLLVSFFMHTLCGGIVLLGTLLVAGNYLAAMIDFPQVARFWEVWVIVMLVIFTLRTRLRIDQEHESSRIHTAETPKVGMDGFMAGNEDKPFLVISSQP